MACASCSTEFAQPRSVLIAGRRSFVISIEIAPAQVNPLRATARSALLPPGRDSELRGLLFFQLFRAVLCKS
jgi:hypothetical protein